MQPCFHDCHNAGGVDLDTSLCLLGTEADVNLCPVCQWQHWVYQPQAVGNCHHCESRVVEWGQLEISPGYVSETEPHKHTQAASGDLSSPSRGDSKRVLHGKQRISRAKGSYCWVEGGGRGLYWRTVTAHHM